MSIALMYLLGRGTIQSVVGTPTRNIANFNGTDNSAKIAKPVSLTGNFEVEIEVALPVIPSAGITKTLLGSVDGGAGSLDFFVTETQTIRAEITGVLMAETAAIPAVFDGELHILKLTRVSGVFRIFVDGAVEVVGSTNNGNVKVDTVGKSDKANSNLEGSVQSVTLTDQSGTTDVVDEFVLGNGRLDYQMAQGRGDAINQGTNSSLDNNIDGWEFDPQYWETV